MKAVRADALSSIADYGLVEAPVPAPRAGEVLVRVSASGVGYVDPLVALGRYQVKPPLPHWRDQSRRRGGGRTRSGQARNGDGAVSLPGSRPS